MPETATRERGLVIVNEADIPAELAPGKYCCRIDESFTWTRMAVRFVTPPHLHEPGDCLVQVIKHEEAPSA